MPEIISIHIPKTAGRSFLSILRSVYGNEHVRHYDRKNYNDKINAVKYFLSELDNKDKIIHGHFNYSDVKSLHEKTNSKIITWLRNPVERVISNYGFFKKRIFESTNDKELERRKDETLIEYAFLENSRNRMSKFMSGIDLKDYFFVGITEHFNDDIQILSKQLSWSKIDIPRINDNSEFKSKLPQVSSEEKRKIEELNKEDMELYFKALLIHHKFSN